MLERSAGEWQMPSLARLPWQQTSGGSGQNTREKEQIQISNFLFKICIYQKENMIQKLPEHDYYYTSVKT